MVGMEGSGGTVVGMEVVVVGMAGSGGTVVGMEVVVVQWWGWR